MQTSGMTTPAPFALLAAGLDDQAELRERLARLEAELARLQARFNEGVASQNDRARWLRSPGPSAEPSAVPMLLAARAWLADEEVKAATRVDAQREQEAAREQAKVAAGDLVVRQYEVPAGKLEALTALMIRDDVPVRVRQLKDRIEVHASARQHESFRHFLDILTPEERSASFRLKGGKMEALWELMKRDDVPVVVEQTGGGIRAHGTATVLRAFAEFIEMIGGESERADAPTALPRTGISGATTPAEMRDRELFAAGRARREADAGLRSYPSRNAVAPSLRRDASPMILQRALAEHARAQANAVQRDTLRSQMQELKSQAEKLTREAEKLQRESEKLQNKADRLRERSESIRESAGEGSDDDRRRAEERAASNDAEADTLEARAHELEAHVAAVEAQVEALESQSEQLEVATETLEAAEEVEQHDPTQIQDEIDAGPTFTGGAPTHAAPPAARP